MVGTIGAIPKARYRPVAAIAIEDASATCVIGRIIEPADSSSLGVKAVEVTEIKAPEFLRTDRSTEDGLKGLDEILRNFSTIIPRDVKVIAISSPGTVDVVGARLLAVPRTGFQNHDSFPFYFRRCFRKGMSIHVNNDTAMGALGEAARRESDALFGYVRVGRGLNGAVIVKGHPWHGILHPEMGHISARRHPSDDLSLEGHCVHGDCLEGLVASTRLRELQKRLKNVATVSEIAAFYVAQLCQAIALITAPLKIVLNVTIPVLGEDSSRFVQRVGAEFGRLVAPYPPKRSFESTYVEGAKEEGSGASTKGALLLAARKEVERAGLPSDGPIHVRSFEWL